MVRIPGVEYRRDLLIKNSDMGKNGRAGSSRLRTSFQTLPTSASIGCLKESPNGEEFQKNIPQKPRKKESLGGSVEMRD